MRVIAIVFLLSGIAQARPAPKPEKDPDPTPVHVILLKPGTVIIGDGGSSKLEKTYYAISRPYLMQLMAVRNVYKETREQNLLCVSALERAGEPTPSWATAVKWGGITGAVVGAFFVGLMVAR